MAIEQVRSYLKKYGIEGKILEFEVSSATVGLAAAALHCESQRIAKTLSFMAEGHAVLVVAAGDAKIDNPKYKAQFGTKAKMLSPKETKLLVGHAVGGVACGSSNSAIELTIPELEKYSGFVSWVDVCNTYIHANHKT